MRLTGLRSFLAVTLLGLALAAKADVTVAWNPATGGTITNYSLYWGTNSGVYIFYANCPGTQTNMTITGLNPGQVYYFSVVATTSDGTQSPFSDEITYTNPVVDSPPTPPGLGDGGGGGGGTNVVGGGTNSPSGGTNSQNVAGGGGGGNTNNAGSSAEFQIQGIPPSLSMSFSNGLPFVTISGTVGATLVMQSSTNSSNPDSWVSITNLVVTNPVVAPATNPAASTLNVAFVPAAQGYQVVDTNLPPSGFFRVMMPYDYSVLADAVLSGQGTPCRTVLVRMPGIVADDVCYVSPQSTFIHFDTTNSAFALEPSGSTIRQIATTLSSSLGLDWTSASEFSYSNGVSSILATVVKTEPPSSDPVAGAASDSIQIDF